MEKVLKGIGWFFGLFFMVFGAIFLAVAIFIHLNGTEFRKGAEKTDAIITDIRAEQVSDSDGSYTDYTVIVEFEVAGEKYSGKLNYYSSSMSIGDTTSIYYKPEDPNKFETAENIAFYFLLGFGIPGAICFLIGVGIIFFISRIGKKQKRIMAYNFMIQADIIGVSLNYSMSMNGQHPYVLEANYMNPSDGMLYHYKSKNLWQDISMIIEHYKIEKISVYVNPNNYSEYVMYMDPITNYLGIK